MVIKLLGCLYVKLKRTVQAETFLRRASELQPRDIEVHLEVISSIFLFPTITLLIVDHSLSHISFYD